MNPNINCIEVGPIVLQTDGDTEERDRVSFAVLQLDVFLHDEFQMIARTPLRP